MGTKERKERESGEMKRKILDAAMDLLVAGGYRNLSIRKVSSRIEYSPAAIYTYFRDKEELMSSIVAEGYGNILKRLGNLHVDPEDPDTTFHSLAHAYVELALSNRNLFRAVLLDDVGKASEQVWMLAEGISKRRESIALLSRVIEMYAKNGVFKPVDPELAALSVWCALHGLVVRLLVEEPVSELFREKLLRQLVELLVGGLRK